MDLQHKLWNMATSQSATTGERLNAIDILEKKRPKDTLVGYVDAGGDSDLTYLYGEIKRLQAEVRSAGADIRGLKAKLEKMTNKHRALATAHTALKTGLASLLGSPSPSPPPSLTRSKAKYAGASSTNPHEALYGALTRTPSTIGELDTVARRNGFDGAINTLRKRAEKLEAAGLIVRADGYPKRWRLK